MNAFQVFVALGFYPTTDGQKPNEDGSNLLSIKPGSWVGTTKTKNEADVKTVSGQDVSPMLNTLKDLIVLTAQITSTPVSRFVVGKQLAGEGTLKEQEQPLKKKAVNRRTLFGNSWEDCMAMARRLTNFFGSGNLNEEVSLSAMWLYTESLDELEKKKKLGVPQEQIWVEMGYTQDQIAVMKESPEYQSHLAALESVKNLSTGKQSVPAQDRFKKGDGKSQ